jgi:hypothetical protein
LRAGGPLVIFPEAATSNGKGLLRFLGTDSESLKSSVLESCHVEGPSKADDSKLTAYILGLRYDYESFAPTLPVGSRILHLFQLMCQVGLD